MTTPFDTAIAKVLAHEGGYVNDPLDRGGETNWGITVGVAREAGYAGPMRDMPVETAKAIYKRNYWNPLKLDAVAALSPALAEEVFDSAVNCGNAVAGKWLQQGLNALNNAGKLYANLVVDGIVGQGTVAALLKLGAKDLATLTKLMNVQQGAHYLAITQRNETQERFIRGWMTRVGMVG